MLEILGKIGFDWQVALANLINFFIVFLLLKKFFFKKIKETIRERRNKIEKGLEDAEKAAESLKSAEIEKDSIVKEAYKESQEIISSAKDKSRDVVSQASIEASKEATKIVDNANAQAATILKKADNDMSEKAAEVVISGITKVLEEKMNDDINESYIKKVLAK